MKKWFLFLFVLIVFTVKTSTIKADSDYKAFQEIQIESGKFLSEYTNSDFKKHYKKVNKRKFWGWRVHEVNTDKKVVYKAETMFSYLNDGETPIEYNYKYNKKHVNTRSLSSSGTIKIDASGTIEKFKGGLNTTLNLNNTSKTETTEVEEYNLKTKVDPGTMLNLYIAGEGKITNGVASNYLFWIRKERGGYEIFTITTQYYRLEKVRI